MNPHLLRLLRVALLLLGIAPAVCGADPPRVWRLAYVGAPGSLFDRTAAQFTTMVSTRLGGRLVIQVAPSGTLGSDEQMIRGVKLGAPEMTLISTVMSSVDATFGVFELPYLISTRAQMKQVAEHPQVRAALFDTLPAQGLRVLGVWENGFRHITNNVRPIVTPADLHGLKLRVPSGLWRVELFKTYGARPLPVPLTEVFGALQAGVVDGQENPLAQIASQHFQEVQRYLSLTGHVYSPLFLLVSEAVWQTLPQDLQGDLALEASQAGNFARAEGERLDRELLGTLVPPMQVNRVDTEAFLRASTPLYDKFGRQVPGGRELIAVIQSLRKRE
jgi:tripartite ATP-independent transporter DctP family solute receptor